MSGNPIVQEYLTSIVIGLSLSVGIVLLTPRHKLISFDEEAESLEGSLGSNSGVSESATLHATEKSVSKVTTISEMENVIKTSNEIDSTDSTHDINGEVEDISQYIDNPEAPTRLSKRRNKKAMDEIQTPNISSEVASAIGKKPKLKKFFGISDESIADAINKAAPDLVPVQSVGNATVNDSQNDSLLSTNGNTPKLTPEARAKVKEAKDEIIRLIDSQEQLSSVESGLLSWVMFLLTLFGIFAALLLINIATNGDFGRIIVGMFPRETEALKIKDFLIKFHN